MAVVLLEPSVDKGRQKGQILSIYVTVLLFEKLNIFRYTNRIRRNIPLLKVFSPGVPKSVLIIKTMVMILCFKINLYRV